MLKENWKKHHECCLNEKKIMIHDIQSMALSLLVDLVAVEITAQETYEALVRVTNLSNTPLAPGWSIHLESATNAEIERLVRGEGVVTYDTATKTLTTLAGQEDLLPGNAAGGEFLAFVLEFNQEPSALLSNTDGILCSTQLPFESPKELKVILSPYDGSLSQYNGQIRIENISESTLFSNDENPLWFELSTPNAIIQEVQGDGEYLGYRVFRVALPGESRFDPGSIVLYPLRYVGTDLNNATSGSPNVIIQSGTPPPSEGSQNPESEEVATQVHYSFGGTTVIISQNPM